MEDVVTGTVKCSGSVLKVETTGELCGTTQTSTKQVHGTDQCNTCSIKLAIGACTDVV